MDVKNISFQILFVLCWLSPGLFAQSFDFHTYSVGEGLAQSQVYALLEDQRGYIWMGTQGGGLSRFDGHDFRNFSTANTPGLSNNYLLSLYEDREGFLWMGTKSGLSRYDGISFTSYPLSSETAVEVYEVLQTQDGNLWVASSQGLFRWQNNQFVALESSLGAPQGKISCLLESSEGQLYLGHQEGLSRQLADGTFEEVSQTGLINREIISLLEAPDGKLWVGTLGGGLHQFDGERFYPLPDQDGLRNAVIFDLLYDENGNLWIATLNQGAAIRSARDSSMSFLSDVDGLPRNHIRCLLEDEWGNLWLGTSGGGVSKYFGQEFFHYDRSDGLGERSIYSVGQDTLGRYWMGVYNRGFSIYDGERFVAHDRRNGFKNVQVKAILQDQRGRMWLGTYGQGLSLFLNDSTYTDFTFAQGLSDAYVWDLAEDSKGNIWVATAGGGINRLHPVADSTDSLHTSYEISSFRQRDGLPQDRINCLHIDSLDRVWFGTANRGIGYIYQDSARLTLSLPGSISDNSVRSMVEDEAGFLWLGTAGGGVHRLNLYAATDSLEFVPFREGLTSDNIYLLGLDEAQQLWIGTESGVDRASLGPDRNIIEIRHYGQSEGFVGIEVCQNAVHRDPAGHLWFGTINGLTHYNPRSTIRNPLPPRLSWEEISLFYTPLQEVEKYQNWVQAWGMVQSGLQLPYNQNTLSFDFIGIDHQNPDQVRYQWKLTELETDWRPVTHQSSATYAQLPPGDYTFLVRAVNGDGVWTPVPMEVAFSIQPPYWQSWWFRAAALGVIALLVGLGLKIRVDQVRRNAREENQRLEMEKDLLGLEQKALRLQMNPHFIFHALNSIQSLISQQDAQTARHFLAKFARLMRSVLENSRDSMIPLVAEIQMLEDYLSLEMFSRHDQFDYRVELDDWIDPEALMIPPMLLQPFVENAIIHGVAHLEHKGRIRLRFERIGQHIECLITDNGIGREAAKKLSSQQNHHQKSTALMVIQERLDILHRGEEAKEWDKSIEIRDLVDPAGKPIGTQVLVRIPIEES